LVKQRRTRPHSNAKERGCMASPSFMSLAHWQWRARDLRSPTTHAMTMKFVAFELDSPRASLCSQSVAYHRTGELS